VQDENSLLLAVLIERVHALNPRYRAFSHLATPVASLEHSGGPLSGIAASVKGNIPVKGMPWTEGSALFAGRRAEQDAAVVTRLREAGAILLGTTTLSELAMYGTTNPFEPMGLNPWDIARTAGGSSTGAEVAAALGLAAINIGTDSGGSIRNPACHCGVVGFMPRRGALPLDGVPDHAPSLSTLGLIGPSVGDVTRAFEVLAAAIPNAAPPSSRLLLPRNLVQAMCDVETLALFAAACVRLATSGLVFIERDVAGWREGEAAAGVVSLYESGQALSRKDLGCASAGIRHRAETAARISAAQIAAARRDMAAFRVSFDAALLETGTAAAVTPTWPFAAPPINADIIMIQGHAVPIDPHRNCFVRAANACGGAAITVPMGFYSEARVPAGLHLIARNGDEASLLTLAARIEATLPRLPPVPVR
jgi:Asp-tRNA(Asn)/Glu-tRNA(Gln) amidotransferase A subunit family amidase